MKCTPNKKMHEKKESKSHEKKEKKNKTKY